MQNIVFRRLFELRILHAYFLDNRKWNGEMKERFHDHLPENQADLLTEKYNIQKDIYLQPTRQTAQLIEAMRLRWRMLPTGLVIGIEVNKIGNRFFPRFPISADKLTFSFLIKVRNAYWYNFTNHAFNLPWPAKYHFTNQIAPGEVKSAPSLSNNPPGFVANSHRTWDMGELRIQNNQLQYATKINPTDSDFEPVNAGKPNYRWANTSDRRVLPKNFAFVFDKKSKPVDTVTFRLVRVSDNAEQKVINHTFSSPPDTFQVNFSDQPNDWYQLETQVNGEDFGPSQRILLSDEVAGSDVFGLVEMVHEAGLSDEFKLFEDDGALRIAEDPLQPNRWRPQAVFDIRLLSRPTYWRYQIKGKMPSATPVQSLGAKTLQTRLPRYLTQSAQRVVLGGSATPPFLPGPDNLNLYFDASRREYFSEIFVSL